MEQAPSISLSIPLQLPVRVVKVNSLPKIIAGGIPVTPINVVLARRQLYGGATPSSLDAYVRASRLYAEFCAHRCRSIIDVSYADFNSFKDALLNLPFTNANGQWVKLESNRRRGNRTAALMLNLINSIAEDIEMLYAVCFDWRKCNLPEELISIIREVRGGGRLTPPSRAHKIKWKPRKITGLPDEQFSKLIDEAHRRWANVIADGDIAFAPEPETQRGALFYRNTSILLTLRYSGCRRSEVTFIRLGDIDRKNSKLYLVTKGHGGEGGERLPVILLPSLDATIWNYVMKYRPDPYEASADNQQKVFLSHSVRNYGQPISPQTVRKIIDSLRGALDPPWNECLTPHMLRHAFAYQIQRLGGPAALTANMRHKSISSNTPYTAGIENFLDEMLGPIDSELKNLLEEAGMLETLVGITLPSA